MKSRPWEGTYDASEYGASCYQSLSTKYPIRSEGKFLFCEFKFDHDKKNLKR